MPPSGRMAQRIAELLQACLASWLLKSKEIQERSCERRSCDRGDSGAIVRTAIVRSCERKYSFKLSQSRNTNREDMLQRLRTCISAICVLRHSLRLHRAHIFTLHCASGVQTDLSSNSIQQHRVPAWPAGRPREYQHSLLVVQGNINTRTFVLTSSPSA